MCTKSLWIAPIEKEVIRFMNTYFSHLKFEIKDGHIYGSGLVTDVVFAFFKGLQHESNKQLYHNTKER